MCQLCFLGHKYYNFSFSIINFNRATTTSKRTRHSQFSNADCVSKPHLLSTWSTHCIFPREHCYDFHPDGAPGLTVWPNSHTAMVSLSNLTPASPLPGMSSGPAQGQFVLFIKSSNANPPNWSLSLHLLDSLCRLSGSSVEESLGCFPTTLLF